LFGPSASPTTTDTNGVERLSGEPDLSHIGTIQMETERKSAAVDDEHPLCALPLLSNADLATTLLGRRERAIEEGYAPVKLALLVERDEGSALETLPHALLAPAFEPAPHGRRCAVLPWQVLPTTPCDEHVEDTFGQFAGRRHAAAQCGREVGGAAV
jgi:hypothetical protein